MSWSSLHFNDYFAWIAKKIRYSCFFNAVFKKCKLFAGFMLFSWLKSSLGYVLLNLRYNQIDNLIFSRDCRIFLQNNFSTVEFFYSRNCHQLVNQSMLSLENAKRLAKRQLMKH